MAIPIYKCSFEPRISISRDEYDAMIRNDAWLEIILASKSEHGYYSAEVIEACRKAKERADAALKAVERCGWVKEPAPSDKADTAKEEQKC